MHKSTCRTGAAFPRASEGDTFLHPSIVYGITSSVDWRVSKTHNVAACSGCKLGVQQEFVLESGKCRRTSVLGVLLHRLRRRVPQVRGQVLQVRGRRRPVQRLHISSQHTFTLTCAEHMWHFSELWV